MRAPQLILVLGAALVACAGGGAGSGSDLPTTSNKPRKDVVVQFTDAAANPVVARVLAGGSVTWVNYATGLAGVVVFPAGVAERLSCGSFGPLFARVAAGYQSIPITRMDGEEVTLPCPLAPGSYDYQLYLGTLGDGGGVDLDNPQLTLRGKIVVE